MRRVSQQQLVVTDERGVRTRDSSGDCFPACIASIFELPLKAVPGSGGNVTAVYEWLALNYPGIGVVSRSWPEPREPEYRQGYWIATVISSRFREPDCGYCASHVEESKPPFHWRRDECPCCGGSGEAPGLHAIVMEHAKRVWDPHPDADWDSEPAFVGETHFVVTDPARLSPRLLPSLAL